MNAQLLIFTNKISENYNIEIEDFMEAHFAFCELSQEDKNIALKWFEIGNQGISLTDNLKIFNEKLKLRLNIDIDEFLDTYFYFTELPSDARISLINKYKEKEFTSW